MNNTNKKGDEPLKRKASDVIIEDEGSECPTEDDDFFGDTNVRRGEEENKEAQPELNLE